MRGRGGAGGGEGGVGVTQAGHSDESKGVGAEDGGATTAEASGSELDGD